VARFWVEAAPGAVVHVAGADIADLRVLPADAPAVVLWQGSGPLEDGTILAALERYALALFPSWLPGAEAMGRAGGTVVAAVRSLALQHAADTGQYGPFVADLAEQAITGRVRRSRFPDPVRAVGLARVVAAGAGRGGVALAVPVPLGLSLAAEEAMVSACERVAVDGRFAVWLIGPAPRSARVRSVAFDDTVAPNESGAGPYWPPRAGRPHPSSPLEQSLEALFCRRAWAAGREWNQTYRVHTLANPIKPDLMWTDERLVVEIDGSEHMEPDHFAADRRRDVDLQLAGYAVLRFPNSEVEHDVVQVLARIERMLTSRRGVAPNPGVADAEKGRGSWQMT
jgi:very-short-patch-repair endonuclease